MYFLKRGCWELLRTYNTLELNRYILHVCVYVQMYAYKCVHVSVCVCVHVGVCVSMYTYGDLCVLGIIHENAYNKRIYIAFR